MLLHYLKRFQQSLLESDNRILAFAGRTLQYYKQFLWGIVAGIVLTFLVSEGWDSGTRWWYSRGWEKRMESRLQAPLFPKKAAANYDWTIQALDGQDLNMTEVKGKVVVLNFWATWCPPCVAEMPSLQRLYETLKDEGVEFVCVSGEEQDTVQKFVQEKGYTFPIYTMEAERPEDFRGRGIPTTFILSKDGKIAFRHVGSAKWDAQASIDFIKTLL